MKDLAVCLLMSGLIFGLAWLGRRQSRLEARGRARRKVVQPIPAAEVPLFVAWVRCEDGSVALSWHAVASNMDPSDCWDDASKEYPLPRFDLLVLPNGETPEWTPPSP